MTLFLIRKPLSSQITILSLPPEAPFPAPELLAMSCAWLFRPASPHPQPPGAAPHPPAPRTAPHLSEHRPFPSPASAPGAETRLHGLWACGHFAASARGREAAPGGWGSCGPSLPQNVASPQVQSSHEKRGRSAHRPESGWLRPLRVQVFPPNRPGSLTRSAAETHRHDRARPTSQRKPTATVSPEKGREKAEAEENEAEGKERLRFCLRSYLNSCTAFSASPCCSAKWGPRPAGRPPPGGL